MIELVDAIVDRGYEEVNFLLDRKRHNLSMDRLIDLKRK